MARRIIAVAASLLLGACATDLKGSVLYRDQPVPVPVSCVPPEFPAAGQYETQATLKNVRGPELFRRLYADWLARVIRMDQTEPLVLRCAEAAPPP